MTRADVVETIKEIVSKVAGIPGRELLEELRIRDELMLDSLKQLEILARTEVKFGIRLEEGKVLCVETIGEYCSVVASAMGLQN